MSKKSSIASTLLVTLALTIGTPALAQEPGSGYLNHQVQAGDTPWLISRKYDVSLNQLLRLNNFNEQTVIFVGDLIKVPYGGEAASPSQSYLEYRVVRGDTPWLLSRRFQVPLATLLQANKLTESSVIHVGQMLKIPQGTAVVQIQSADRGQTSRTPVVSFTNHTIKQGETLWLISKSYGVPVAELLNANSLTARDVLHVGQTLKVPVYQIPVRPTASPEHGELLDWWTEAQYVFPIGAIATVTDFYTKKSWRVVRSYGANHADVEPLTPADTAIMKAVWGGNWSWTARPVIVEVNGRRIAASANGMPHSIQEITTNNFNGHFCIHFLNSRQHNNNLVNQSHQRAVNIAAGK